MSSTEVDMLATRNAALAGIDGSRRYATAALAGVLGVFFVYFTAFAHSPLMHNAAHDMRHAITAPCH